MKNRFLLLLMFSTALFSQWAGASVSLGQPAKGPIGRQVQFMQEARSQLTLDEAVSAWQAGRFHPGRSPVLNFGIGARPVWIHLRVDNPRNHIIRRQLTVATPWLDWVDIYFRRDGRTVHSYHLGDRQPFAQRPVDSRYFAVVPRFPPGTTDVFLRIQTPDPMVVPLFLFSPRQVMAQDRFEDYSYGLLYGFLFALLAYNVLLFTGLRQAKYLLYSLYLAMFLAMNLSYTGHAFAWFWPDSTRWAQWSQPTLMMLYAASGLIFALSFLELRRHFPRLFAAVLGYIVIAAGLLGSLIGINDQRDALLLAFGFVSLFTLIMLALGIVAVRAGITSARYFLLAAVSAMVGAATTAMAVWGFIPFNVWTFRAVDIGMLLDASLLALALAYQFRTGQEERARAEQLARLDPLTGLNNRRAFYDISGPICNISQRHHRDLSVILLDLDHFKHVNDDFGHHCGDVVLRETASVLMQSIRDHDVIARWGGEEFILLLPETELEEAVTLAERLRQAVGGHQLSCDGQALQVTASFGVAQKSPGSPLLADVIQAADRELYRAKDSGRNRVCYQTIAAHAENMPTA